MKASLLLTFFTLITLLELSAQLKQTIRGRVIDQESGEPLAGVNLIIPGTNPLMGTATNMNGEFRFNELPLGRYSIELQYLGYETKVANDILVEAGKEIVLTIGMQEALEKIDEVVVSARKNKGEALNSMATVSARSFSVDETKRYAGSFNDPARMASSFAGVSGDPGGDNDIIIRGNSPRGLQWRLEGIEIPNPNHFANEGRSGGPISILNSNMLSNSDFFTGAFPAEYGNAYSGVFDLKLRKGNNEKREYSFMAGLMGTDCSLEGPFVKGGEASYLFNYRYSTLAMLNAIGLKIVGDVVPVFQDIAFNISLPTKKLGNFQVFGIGALSKSYTYMDEFRDEFATSMGVIGFTNQMRLSKSAFLTTTLAATGTGNDWEYLDKDSLFGNTFIPKGHEQLFYKTGKATVTLNKKINAHHSFKMGIIYSNLNYDLFSDFYNDSLHALETVVEQDGSTDLSQSFLSWKYRVTEKLSFTGGLHFMYFHLNNKNSLEPRLGFRWQFAPTQAISGGIGIHSRIESLTNYLARQKQDDGSIVYPNKDVGFSKARHFVLGYDRMIKKDLSVKVETYYQYLYEIPVEDSPTSTFSALNFSGGYTNVKMVNKGTGYNYGLEMTLEKYFSKKYYFLLTGSLYESKYKDNAGNFRNTMFNGNTAFNTLAGREFVVHSNGKLNTLTVSIKGSWAGGLRYTPINLSASEEKGYTVRYDENPFSHQRGDFIRYDLKLQYRINKHKTTRQWEIDVQNVTNRLNVAGDWYNADDNKVETWTQLGIVPVLSYRIMF